jgi:hypothetical protein
MNMNLFHLALFIEKKVVNVSTVLDIKCLLVENNEAGKHDINV